MGLKDTILPKPVISSASRYLVRVCGVRTWNGVSGCPCVHEYKGMQSPWAPFSNTHISFAKKERYCLSCM